jgi:hypothetical protein
MENDELCSRQVFHQARTSLLLSLILGLVEQEVRGKLLVLVARKVRLDDIVAFEAEPAELNGQLLSNGCRA